MRSNKPYVPLDPALIEQARQIDLLTYGGKAGGGRSHQQIVYAERL